MLLTSSRSVEILNFIFLSSTRWILKFYAETILDNVIIFYFLNSTTIPHSLKQLWTFLNSSVAPAFELHLKKNTLGTTLREISEENSNKNNFEPNLTSCSRPASDSLLSFLPVQIRQKNQKRTRCLSIHILDQFLSSGISRIYLMKNFVSLCLIFLSGLPAKGIGSMNFWQIYFSKSIESKWAF